MSIVAWIVLGLLAGFIASKIVKNSGSGVVVDVVLGIVGALVGGLLFHVVGAKGIDGFSTWSLMVAVVGAVVVLGVKHVLVGAPRAALRKSKART
jgi:uncharacterized membrane protein YeaQ/YmgE (transglycosylase-associated protein family)